MEIIARDKQNHYALSDFENAVAKADSIETMPAVAQQLLAITSDPDFSMSQLHDLVQSDPAIAAKILRIASSPFYGSRAATNLRSALIRIGIRDLRKLIMASAMIGGKLTKFNEALWTYSLKVAAISEAIAQLVPTKDLDDPFLCGLLHDFGTVIMNKVIGKKYRSTIGTPCQEDQSSLELEHFGFDHCDLGVMVAQQWALFEALEHVMQHHHKPELVEELGLDDSSKIAVLVVSLARHAALDQPEHEASQVALLCQKLQLSSEELTSCTNRGLKAYSEMYAALLSGR